MLTCQEHLIANAWCCTVYQPVVVNLVLSLLLFQPCCCLLGAPATCWPELSAVCDACVPSRFQSQGWCTDAVTVQRAPVCPAPACCSCKQQERVQLLQWQQQARSQCSICRQDGHCVHRAAAEADIPVNQHHHDRQRQHACIRQWPW